MKTLHTLLAATVSVGLLASCSKSNDEGSVSFRLQTTNRSSNTGRVTGGTLAWTSGSAYVTNAKLEAKNQSQAEVEFKTPVNRRVDLFASVSTLGNVTLSPGTYQEVEVKLDLASTATDTALVMRGTFTNSSGVSTPVVFVGSNLLEFKSEAHNVTLTGSGDFTFTTSINLSVVTSAITEALLNAATRTNGAIVISASSNTALYALFLAHLDDCDEVEMGG